MVIRSAQDFEAARKLLWWAGVPEVRLSIDQRMPGFKSQVLLPESRFGSLERMNQVGRLFREIYRGPLELSLHPGSHIEAVVDQAVATAFLTQLIKVVEIFYRPERFITLPSSGFFKRLWERLREPR